MNRSHPNFPVGLAIAPNSQPMGDDLEAYKQREAIEQYGIAGRIWDASYPILSYLSRPSQENKLEFSPACSIFARSQQDGDTVNVLELGSGQSMGTLHLLDQLSEASSQASPRKQPDKVFLSDLPDVIPLCQASIGRWKSRKGKEREVDIVQVEAVPLAWGDMDMGSRLAEQLQASGRRLTHILLLDLVYFPHLYPSLMRTLLQVTMPPFGLPANKGDETGGPEVILCYKTRSLEFEEPFFLTLGKYFYVEPLLSRNVIQSEKARPQEDNKMVEEPNWQVHGVLDETYTYICRRWSRTLRDTWRIPETDAALMNGQIEPSESDDEARVEARSRTKTQDRAWGWIENQLAAIEWDG